MESNADAIDSKKVDAYINKHAQWSELLSRLRKIILSTGLEESVKWGSPAYTLQGKVVVTIAAFKQHASLWFHQGVFLKDKQKQLYDGADSSAKAMRQWRFQPDSKVDAKLIKAYVVEAIANEKAGKKVKPVAKAMVMPVELAQALKKDRALQQAFDSLTPGKQREYADHIGAAKQEQTRLSRLSKAMPMIKAGTGLNDKYKNC